MRRARSGFPLLLHPPQARAVARRAKTQLRRLASTVTLAGGARAQRACGLHVANTYEVAAADKPDERLARVVVTDVRLARLGTVGEADAIAEGHESVRAFADWWLTRHDRGWPPKERRLCSNCAGWAKFTDHDGNVVACTLCDLGEVLVELAADDPVRQAAALELWPTYADRRVWVVSFMLDERTFLHRDVHRGYTSNPAEAAAGEPEVIGEPRREWLTRAESARRRDQADVDSTRLSGLPSLDDQLAELRRMAAERGVDLTREQAVVDQRTASIERKLDKAA